MEWRSVTCDRLGTVTQCQKKHKWHIFSDLWIRMSMFTVQNKWDRCGFFTRDIWSLKSSHKVGTHKILLLYSRIFPFLIWIHCIDIVLQNETRWGWGRLQCACTAPAPQHIWCVVCMICVRGNMDSITIGAPHTSRAPPDMNSYIEKYEFISGDLWIHTFVWIHIPPVT